MRSYPVNNKQNLTIHQPLHSKNLFGFPSNMLLRLFHISNLDLDIMKLEAADGYTKPSNHTENKEMVP